MNSQDHRLFARKDAWILTVQSHRVYDRLRNLSFRNQWHSMQSNAAEVGCECRVCGRQSWIRGRACHAFIGAPGLHVLNWSAKCDQGCLLWVSFVA